MRVSPSGAFTLTEIHWAMIFAGLLSLIILHKAYFGETHEVQKGRSYLLKDTVETDFHSHVDSKPRVLMIFTNAGKNEGLQNKFRICIKSLLELASNEIDLVIVGDSDSQQIAQSILTELDEKLRAKAQLQFLEMESVGREVGEKLGPDLLQYFRHSANAYYGDYLFFISMVADKLFPSWDKLIQLDCDLKFKADIFELWDAFHDFKPEELIGIGREMQPVYRHIWSTYRRLNPSTPVGDPPPKGITGFNSGVLLMDLRKIRESKRYSALLSLPIIESLAEKYKFKGHLGDQDFYSLISTENWDIFHILPCEWNRQLCQWWKSHGYENVWHLYHRCDKPVKIYHGNCNTPIPND